MLFSMWNTFNSFVCLSLTYIEHLSPFLMDLKWFLWLCKRKSWIIAEKTKETKDQKSIITSVGVFHGFHTTGGLLSCCISVFFLFSLITDLPGSLEDHIWYQHKCSEQVESTILPHSVAVTQDDSMAQGYCEQVAWGFHFLHKYAVSGMTKLSCLNP